MLTGGVSMSVKASPPGGSALSGKVGNASPKTAGATKNDPRYKKMEPKEDKSAGDSCKECENKKKNKKPFKLKAEEEGPGGKPGTGTPGTGKSGTGTPGTGNRGPLKGGVGTHGPSGPLKGGTNTTPHGPLRTGTTGGDPNPPKPGPLTPRTPTPAPTNPTTPPHTPPKPPLRGVLTTDEANRLFKELEAKKDKIPFDYPDNCCYSRAEAMCEILEAQGISTNKVWILDTPADRYFFQHDTNAPPLKATLIANTPNHPKGYVKWWYHVATVVKVQGPDGKVRDMVFDPSLFDHPVTPQEWANSMHNPQAKPRIGHRDWYSPGKPVTASTPTDTQMELQVHANARAQRKKELQHAP
jgi:hypothetical protein